MGLARFAQSGQGVGSRSRKAGVAAGGRANADDRKQAPEFTSGKTSLPKGSPRMNQAPTTTRKGAKGTSLPLGKQTPSVSGARSSVSGDGSRGARGTALPLGRQRQ